MKSKGLVWLRRDLRLWDNHALASATAECDSVTVVFVFDSNILSKLPKKDHRVDFLFSLLDSMKDKVNILFGDPIKLIPQFAKKNNIDQVYINRDYETYAIERDSKVQDSLFESGINLKSFKDQVVFEKDQVLNGKGDYYKVFTPYKNSYLALLNKDQSSLKVHKVNLSPICNSFINEVIKIEDIGHEKSDVASFDIDPIPFVKSFLSENIDTYDECRDFPIQKATSKLSLYIRFGVVSIRSLFIKALEKKSKGRDIWVSELIWRDFYSMILQVDNKIEKHPFNSKYNDFKWDKNQNLLDLWKNGETGVPIVDAAMKQLNQTGFMHNRLRMVVASYLTKTMLLDYREGEKYFAKMLYDFDLASNNGGWQWAASTGCDAAPYFRVFNPYRQSERFDKEGEFIKSYLPELKNLPRKFIHDPSKMSLDDQLKYGVYLDKDYPRPVVDYTENRKIIIQRFKDHG